MKSKRILFSLAIAIVTFLGLGLSPSHDALAVDYGTANIFVNDSITQKPIYNSYITLISKATGYEFISSNYNDGHVYWKNIPVGEYTLIARNIDYKESEKISLTISQGVVVGKTIKLEPKVIKEYGSVNISITDSLTNEYLKDSYVALISKVHGCNVASSNSNDGKINFKNVLAGEYTLVVKNYKYKEISPIDITIKSGSVNGTQISMEPKVVIKYGGVNIRVIDSTTKNMLRNSYIALINKTYGYNVASSNANNGNVYWKNIPEGEYKLVIRNYGYQPVESMDITVTANAIFGTVIKLSK